jgi:copper chaperone CopZ
MKKTLAVISILALLLVGGAVAGEKKAPEGQVTSTFEVGGMTCGGCASKIRLGVKELAGVSDVKVSHDENIAMVSYDPEKVNPDQIIKSIEKAGFQAKLKKDKA